MAYSLSELQHSVVEQLVRSARIPGAAVAVIQNGRVSAGAFGLANVAEQVPITLESLFPLASVTKSFTATAVMQLVEEGRINLDQPVTDLLPWFQVADEGAAEKMTVRMLLDHTSGLGRTLHLDPTAGATYPTRRALAEGLVTAKLQTPPGEAWSYSNEGYSLAGHLVDVVGDLSFEEHLQERILNPLGMDASTPDITVWHRSPHRAFGYAINASGETVRVPDLPVAPASLPAGRLSSNVLDMARYLFAAMVHEQNPVLSPASLAQMQSASSVWGDTNWGYGLGWMVQHGPAGKIVRHGGNQMGTATYLLMLPEHQIGVVVLTNLSAAPAKQIAEELASATLGRPILRPTSDAVLPIRSAYQASAEAVADCAGTFTADMADATVSVGDNGALRIDQKLRATGQENKMDTLAIGPDLFIIIRKGSEGQPVRFLRNEAGTVDRMILAGTLYRRV